MLWNEANMNRFGTLRESCIKMLCYYRKLINNRVVRITHCFPIAASLEDLYYFYTTSDCQHYNFFLIKNKKSYVLFCLYNYG